MNNPSKVLALIAEILAVQAVIDGMKSENACRTGGGNSPAYGIEHFYEQEATLKELARKAREEFKEEGNENENPSS